MEDVLQRQVLLVRLENRENSQNVRLRGSELLVGAEAQDLPRLNLVGTPSERPWYFAVAASSGVHLALIAVAGWIFIDAKASVRPIDLEAAWVEGEVPETIAQPALGVVELPPGPGGTDKNPTAPGQPSLESPTPGNQVGQPAPLGVKMPHDSRSLTSQWLAESRSGKGLTDLVGPVVYGADGRPDGTGGSGGGGNGGSGGGSGGGMKSSFFGIHADARRVVYVVDASTSMNRPYDGEAKTRFGQMKLELAKSILSLKPEQQFFIIFFNEHPIPMPANGMANAIGENQQQYLTWMASVPATGLTDPRPSISQAMSLNPDVVYFLTDGAFPRDVQSDLSKLKQRSVQINTIAFGDIKAEKSLKPLAMRNGGRFAFVP
jgi:hypothetical protein